MGRAGGLPVWAKTYPGRVMRDIRREIARDEALLLRKASVLQLPYAHQKKRQEAFTRFMRPIGVRRGKGKGHKPYEFDPGPETGPDCHHQTSDAAPPEPVIGHCKDDHRVGRNFLAHRKGDASNAVPARRLVAWLGIILCFFRQAPIRAPA